MQRLKKAIGEAIKKAGLKKALEQESAVKIWGEVVGEKIKNNVKAERVENGRLFVKTHSSTWRQELQMQQEKIVLKINKKIGANAIKEIRII